MKTGKSLLSFQLPKNIHLTTLLPRLQEEKTRAFTTLAFTLIAIVIFGLFAINPTLGTIADLSKQLDDSNFVNQQLTQKVANLTKLQQQYATTQKDIPVVLAAIPTTPTIALFIGQIQTIANTANVELVRFQTFPVEIPLGDQPVASYTSYIFSADVQGDLTNINAFITSLNSFSRITTIDGISVTQVNAGGVQTRANIRGKVYFKK